MTVQSISYPVTLDASGVPKPLSIPAPQGFGTILGLTFANNTPFVALVKGARDSYANQESVMPYVVQRWPYSNTTGAIRVTWDTSSTSAPGSMPSIVVNWSDDPEHDLPGAYPLLTNAGILAGLQGQGIVGASGGLKALFAGPVASGNNGIFPALAGASPNMALWNWMAVPSVPASSFTTGYADIQGAAIVFDAMGPNERASSRIAGIIIPNDGTFETLNNFNQTAQFIALVSPHA